MKDNRKPRKIFPMSRAVKAVPGYGRRATYRRLYTHSWAVADGIAG